VKIFATYNIKGGVGKTAAAVNLAYLSAAGGARTLLWDLDPQGAATFYFRVRPKVKGGGRKLLIRDRDLDNRIKGSDFENLDLLPADFSYRHMDLFLDETKKPTRHLKKLLKPLSSDYDHVFLDCPPSISLVSESVFHAADVLLIPLIPTTLSLRTLEQLSGFLDDRAHGRARMMPFFSMVDRRKKLHREVCATLPEREPAILDSAIPNASDVERMGLERSPVSLFAARSPAGRAYSSLWAEIMERVNGP
jgi:cellulose biosynthesis protein BcsQ